MALISCIRSFSFQWVVTSSLLNMRLIVLSLLHIVHEVMLISSSFINANLAMISLLVKRSSDEKFTACNHKVSLVIDFRIKATNHICPLFPFQHKMVSLLNAQKTVFFFSN